MVNNQFVGNEDEYYRDTQLYQMIMQLYTLYLQGIAIDGPPKNWTEMVLDLGPRESVLRPSNVALWTFCEMVSP